MKGWPHIQQLNKQMLIESRSLQKAKVKNLKKYLSLLLLFFYLAGIVFAQPEEEKNFAVGILSGFYFMQDNVFQETYGKSLPFFGGECYFKLPLKNIEAGLNFKHMRDKGKTTFIGEEINLAITSISLSFRYFINFNKFTPFLGPGIDCIFYKEKYPDAFPVESMKGSSFGFHIQAGCYYHINHAIAVKAFFKHNISKTENNSVKVTLGGAELGIGFIYYFNL